MSAMQTRTGTLLQLSLFFKLAFAARQPYDAHKIIDAFRQPHDDLTMICAHRGQRWNGTTENSRDAYFRATQAGIECIETDIRLSADGHVVMIHDAGIGRETDVGEYTGQTAYNPYTGEGYNPAVKQTNYTGFMDHLHLRDEGGRVHFETVPTLSQMVESIHESRANVVLQLDFKDREAVAPAYYALKTLQNAAGVPANEWCIYKTQARWWKTPKDFESEAWVQDAFRNNISLALLPVYQPADTWQWDTMSSIRAFQKTNYTISAEIDMRSTNGPLQEELDLVKARSAPGATFNSTGIFFAIGDFVEPISTAFFDTANYTLPDDERVNNTVYIFHDGEAPSTQDSRQGNETIDGHDYRTDFAWILEQGYNWVIADTPDLWHQRLEVQGRRNLTHIIADGQEAVQPDLARGYYV